MFGVNSEKIGDFVRGSEADDIIECMSAGQGIVGEDGHADRLQQPLPRTNRDGPIPLHASRPRCIRRIPRAGCARCIVRGCARCVVRGGDGRALGRVGGTRPAPPRG